MWNKQSYISLAWGGIGGGAILFFLNVMLGPTPVIAWLSIGLIIVGIWSASRARRWTEPTPAATSGAGEPQSLDARLTELDQLRAAGRITEEEHAEARRRALGAP
ncbi:hypothetical protein [Microbacterium sp. NPDC096154]|uniref:hypothetical protein n=1 Tax=Microbacterium sp. NPDC096154 TaxID=3155549 RepID=UPI0033214769